MSTMYYAQAVIGIKIASKDFENKAPDDLSGSGDEEGMWNTFPTFRPANGDDIIIGLAGTRMRTQDADNVGDYCSMSMLAVHVLVDRKADLKALLEPCGLWNERAFGLWAILHIHS